MPVAALLALAFCGSSFEETYSFHWKPVVGYKVAYRMRAEIKAEGSIASFSADNWTTVTEVRPDGGYTAQMVSKNIVTQSPSGEERQPDETSTVSFDASGNQTVIDQKKNENKSEDEDGDDDDRMKSGLLAIAQLYPPKAPVAIGGTWTHRISSDEAKHRAAAKITYELESLGVYEGLPSLHVSYTYKETGGDAGLSATGEFEVSPIDFTMIHFKGRVEGLSPDHPEIVLKLTSEKLPTGSAFLRRRSQLVASAAPRLVLLGRAN